MLIEITLRQHGKFTVRAHRPRAATTCKKHRLLERPKRAAQDEGGGEAVVAERAAPSLRVSRRLFPGEARLLVEAQDPGRIVRRRFPLGC